MKTPLDMLYSDILSKYDSIPNRASDYERGQEVAYSEVLDLIESFFEYEKNQIQVAFIDGGEKYDEIQSHDYYENKYK